MKLQDKLQSLDKYPFHMPGHKRNGKFNIVGSEIDITEIKGFDNLHAPTGIIADIENDLAKIYKAKKSFISVNGSSGGILAAIHSFCNYNDTIIIARNCHKSVYNACVLLNLNVVFIEPEYDRDNGYYTRIEQSVINNAINKNPDAKAVVITTPTYEGYISKIGSSIPLIIDAAHGAHFGISYFPEYPKADIVISSLHKTLPALTQTAVVNVYNEEYISRVKRFMDIFQTTSPSYVLMNSIGICTNYIKNNRMEFAKLYEKICDFRLIELENLKLKYNDDISKIIISTADCNISASKLANMLRNDFKIEPEMVSKNYVLLMITIGDEALAIERLKEALIYIDNQLSKSFDKSIIKPPITKEKVKIEISDYSIQCEIDNAVGKISNEFVYAYPPDIPIIVPNETITKESVEYIKQCLKSGVNIISDSSLLPNMILTKQM